MAVDKGYGSGKSRSAANSADRRTKAASANLRKKNIQKVASKPFQKQALASVGKQAAAGFNIGGRQYLETGVSGNKLSQFFSGLSKSRDANQWNARFGRMSSAEEMSILQKASRGTPAGRGGIRGIRAGQKKAE